MLFTSHEFFIFFMILLGFLHIFRNSSENFKKCLLIIASYFFYGYWSFKALLLIFILTIINYWIGEQVVVEKTRRKTFLWINVIFNLGILCYFKYYNFFIESIHELLSADKLLSATINIIMPLGISFYIFQIMTYSIDIYKQKISPASFLDFTLYVSFFPKLTVGPITTASHFIPQLTNSIKINKKNLSSGASLFLIGLVKKKILADSLTIFVDEIFNNIDKFNGISLFCASIGYTMQIYYDFSGYSDMAIGVAKILGFELPINFNYPYRSKSVTEFWRRWHMSLSFWFRDYLYIPLGGARRGTLRTYYNLFVTFMLCGLWHGAGLNFIVWGILHGIGIIVHKIFTKIQQTKKIITHSENKFQKNLKVIAALFINNIFIMFGWIIFRANNLSDAWNVILKILKNAQGVQWVHISFLLVTPIFLLWHFTPYISEIKTRYVKFDSLIGITVSMAMIIAVLLFSPQGSSPFIYFQF